MPRPEFAAFFGRLTANHLWQSTAFAALAVLLALALKASQYPARCWLRLVTFRRLARSCLPSLRSGPLVFPRWLPPRPIELAA